MVFITLVFTSCKLVVKGNKKMKSQAECTTGHLLGHVYLQCLINDMISILEGKVIVEHDTAKCWNLPATLREVILQPSVRLSRDIASLAQGSW